MFSININQNISTCFKRDLIKLFLERNIAKAEIEQNKNQVNILIELNNFIRKPYITYYINDTIEEVDDQLLFDQKCPNIYTNNDENNKLYGCKCNLNNIECLYVNYLHKFPQFKFKFQNKLQQQQQ